MPSMQSSTVSQETNKYNLEPIKSYLILIIEDDPALSNLYLEKFKMEGFNVIVANDGETGLHLAKDKNPDFILLDIMLPKVSGFQILEELKNHPRARYIPIIALTNLASREQASKAINMGVKEYLAKAMHTPEDIVIKAKQYLPR